MAKIRILSEWAQTGASMHALLLAEHLQNRHEVRLCLTGGDIQNHPLPTHVKVNYYQKDTRAYRPNWPFWVSICVRYRQLLHQCNCPNYLYYGDTFQTKVARIEHDFYVKCRPVPEQMMSDLVEQTKDIDAIIVFGNYNEIPYFLPQQLRGKTILIPLVHQEKSQYLIAAKKIMLQYNFFAYNTDVERSIARQIHPYRAKWDESIGIGMDERILAWAQEGEQNYAETWMNHPKYLFYAGRWTHQKMGLLIPYFEEFLRHHPDTDLQLWMSGPPPDETELPDFVKHFGYVDESFKCALMKKAVAVVNPSYVESLSLIVLEAMVLGTPIIVNAHCDVLEMHAQNNRGFAYKNSDEFEESIEQLLEHEGVQERIVKARAYVNENYTWEQVNAKWDQLLQLVHDTVVPEESES